MFYTILICLFFKLYFNNFILEYGIRNKNRNKQYNVRIEIISQSHSKKRFIFLT